MTPKKQCHSSVECHHGARRRNFMSSCSVRILLVIPLCCNCCSPMEDMHKTRTFISRPLRQRATYEIANWQLAKCECGLVGSVIGIWDEWALGHQCSSELCHKQWFSCSDCPRGRTRMYNRQQLRDHKRKLHQVPSKRQTLCLIETIVQATSATLEVVAAYDMVMDSEEIEANDSVLFDSDDQVDDQVQSVRSL